MRVGIEHTDRLSVDTGVIQGDSLSHKLFNIVLDFVLSQLRTIDGGIEWAVDKHIKDLDNADDICLFASDIEEMKQIMELVIEEVSKVGLMISTRKAELMKIRCTSDNQRVTIDGTDLKEV